MKLSKGLMIKRLLLFNLTSLFLLILATRLATFLHEGLGHGLTGILLGGNQLSIKISLFGGGRTFINFHEQLSSIERFNFSMGGILVNLISGMLVFLIIMKKRGDGILKLFLILFAGCSIIGALHHTIVGSYYGVGDPASWVISEIDKSVSENLWWMLLFPLVFMSFLFIKRYMEYVILYFSGGYFFKRLMTIVLTLGITVVTYGMLFSVFNQELHIVDSSKIAMELAIEKVRLSKYEDLKARSPEGTEIKLDQIPVSRNEIEIPLPISPFLVLIYCLSILVALLRWQEKNIEKRDIVQVRDCVYTGFLAIMVLAIVLKVFN